MPGSESSTHLNSSWRRPGILKSELQTPCTKKKKSFHSGYKMCLIHSIRIALGSWNVLPSSQNIENQYHCQWPWFTFGYTKAQEAPCPEVSHSEADGFPWSYWHIHTMIAFFFACSFVMIVDPHLRVSQGEDSHACFLEQTSYSRKVYAPGSIIPLLLVKGHFCSEVRPLGRRSKKITDF